jgi:hypothetical protein
VKTLYHLTAQAHWLSIDATGEIISAEEKQRRGFDDAVRAPFSAGWEEWERRLDDLVWLTADPSPTVNEAWSRNSGQSKLAVCIAVACPDAVKWQFYHRREKWPGDYLRMIHYAGTRPDFWYVSERPIPRSEWLWVSGGVAQGLQPGTTT